MAYTPINWQTGDTITAEKMNKMDNGWAVVETQLFSESVTTSITDPNYPPYAEFTYNQLIDYDTIRVTFNGVDYVCNRIGTGNLYGGHDQSDYDFSQFPFVITSYTQDGVAHSFIETENEGTYTVAIAGAVTEVGNGFSNAVNAVDKENELKVVSGVTTWAEADSAIRSGKTVYSYIDSSQKALYLQSYTNGQQYVIAGVTVYFTSANGLAMVNMQASSSDGVLS